MIDRLIRFNTAKKQLDEKLGELENLELIRNFKRIELRNVTFKYNNSSLPIVIPDFVIEKGDKIVITGESGQGKTTAMNILAGLYKGENGELLIDGKEYKNSKLDLAFVSQEVELFDVSVRENLSRIIIAGEISLRKYNVKTTAIALEHFKNSRAISSNITNL